jgi:ADP-ribosylglycohydrolase
MSQPDFRRDAKPTLLKREAARNLAHVVKIGGHHDTAACISAIVAEMFHGTVTVNSHLNAATNRAYALAEAL